METGGGGGGVGRVALKVSDRHTVFSLIFTYYLYLGWTVLPLPGLDSTTSSWAGQYYLYLRWTVLPLPGLDSTTSTWAGQY